MANSLSLICGAIAQKKYADSNQPLPIFLIDALKETSIENLPDWQIKINRIAFAIHVAKQIHVDYGPDWNKRQNNKVLKEEWLPAVLAVFLKSAGTLSKPSMRAKCLNGAFVLLDQLNTSEKDATIAALEEEANNLLQSIA